MISYGKFVMKMAKYNKVETPDLTPLRSTTVKFVLKMAKYNKVVTSDFTPLRSTMVKFVLKMAKYKVETQVVVNATTMQTQPRRPLIILDCLTK